MLSGIKVEAGSVVESVTRASDGTISLSMKDGKVRNNRFYMFMSMMCVLARHTMASTSFCQP